MRDARPVSATGGQVATDPTGAEPDAAGPAVAAPSGPVDVAVLGAGPAGIPAALAAADAGAQVVLIDANPRPGGQYHRQLPREVSAVRPGVLHHGWPEASERFAALAAHPRIRLLSSTRVWLAEPRPDEVRLHTTGLAQDTIHARQLVLATGATERVLPFPGWDLPGVLTVGAAQALIKGQGIRPGRRVLLAGTGPLLLAAAGTLLTAGTEVVAVLDANGSRQLGRAVPAAVLSPGRSVEAAGYLAQLARHRTPYRPGMAVVRVEGDGEVERAVVAEVDADWRVRLGTEHHLDVDAVCVAYGFTPNVGVAAAVGCELAPRPDGAVVVVDVGQRTSRPRVLAAGELTGVQGASVAALEGAVAGAVAAAAEGHPVDRDDLRRLVRRRDRARRAADTLLRAAPIRAGWRSWLDDETVVCRCEEVEYRTVRHAIEELGAKDVRSLKMTTRCGMGRCQAAICGPIVSDLVAEHTGAPPADATGLAPRAIAESIPLGEL